MQAFHGVAATAARADNGGCSTALNVPITDDLRSSVDTLEKQGYMLIGSSSFNAPEHLITDAELREQTKHLGACAVLAWSQYADTVPDSPSNAHLILPGHWYREGRPQG
jgi:hypothetical protein